MARERREARPEATRLVYTGPAPKGFVPLPEGWPALDHEERDETVRAEKLASGFYDIEGVQTDAGDLEE